MLWINTVLISAYLGNAGTCEKIPDGSHGMKFFLHER